jgi:hypothetical protein
MALRSPSLLHRDLPASRLRRLALPEHLHGMPGPTDRTTPWTALNQPQETTVAWEELHRSLIAKRTQARDACLPNADPIELEWLASRIRTLNEVIALMDPDDDPNPPPRRTRATSHRATQ